jgi:hypothetical protein
MLVLRILRRQMNIQFVKIAQQWQQDFNMCVNSNEDVMPSRSWSLGSWIYNYLYNQCLPHCEFESHSCGGVPNKTLYDKVCRDLRQVGSFSGYLDFLYQQNYPPRYNWNIVESDIKHHNSKHTGEGDIIKKHQNLVNIAVISYTYINLHVDMKLEIFYIKV